MADLGEGLFLMSEVPLYCNSTSIWASNATQGEETLGSPSSRLSASKKNQEDGEEIEEKEGECGACEAAVSVVMDVSNIQLGDGCSAHTSQKSLACREGRGTVVQRYLAHEKHPPRRVVCWSRGGGAVSNE
jgi:hypothetical protein